MGTGASPVQAARTGVPVKPGFGLTGWRSSAAASGHSNSWIRYESEVLKLFRGAHTNRRLLVLISGLALFVAFTAAAAQARNWRITDFKDTVSISADGTALVSEKITLAFAGEWHGIHRTIPVEYPGPQGTNYTLFLDILSVTDESGNKLKYESSKSGAYRDLKIYIPGAVDTTRVVNIDYSVRNGVRFFDSNNDNYAEFY